MEFFRRILITALLIVLSWNMCLNEEGLLSIDYYRDRCPFAEEIVRREVEIALIRDPRMAASLLRLQFHDCFVMGCDASVLLDDMGDIVSEKQAGPNRNSLRGFEVVDRIKFLLEEACPSTVSCADILAIAARDSVTLRGGPWWEVWLGRRDSLKASFDGANKFIPNPNSSLSTLISNFAQQGLNVVDLVALSGGHTMGKARCTNFRNRIYNQSLEELHYDYYQRTTVYRRILGALCPQSGGDNTIGPLDYRTPARFDNYYYRNLLEEKGLLHSDSVLLYEDDEGEVRSLVWRYAEDQDLFFASFAESIVKMGNINVLTGHEGEIRRNCSLQVHSLDTDNVKGYDPVFILRFSSHIYRRDMLSRWSLLVWVYFQWILSGIRKLGYGVLGRYLNSLERIFDKYFWSSSRNFKNERMWILQFHYQGLHQKEEEDSYIYTQIFVLESLLS